MTHPSHFFEPVEGFIHTHPEKIDIAVLNSLATHAGCPAEKIEAVVNGAIADLLQACIAPVNNSITVYDKVGNPIPDKRIAVSKPELIEAVVAKFGGFTEDRATKLIDYLILKGVLIIDTQTGIVYSQTKYVARQLIVI